MLILTFTMLWISKRYSNWSIRRHSLLESLFWDLFFPETLYKYVSLIGMSSDFLSAFVKSTGSCDLSWGIRRNLGVPNDLHGHGSEQDEYKDIVDIIASFCGAFRGIIARPRLTLSTACNEFSFLIQFTEIRETWEKVLKWEWYLCVIEDPFLIGHCEFSIYALAIGFIDFIFMKRVKCQSC